MNALNCDVTPPLHYETCHVARSKGRRKWKNPLFGRAVVALACCWGVLPNLSRGCEVDSQKRDGASSQSDVEAFLQHYIETLESKNEAAIRNLFVDDDRFAWFTDGALSYSSANDVLDGMKRFGGIQFKTTITDIHVVMLGGNLASIRSKFSTTLIIPEADDFTYSGVITLLLEKSGNDDEWKIILGHTSTPGGPPKSTHENGGEEHRDRRQREGGERRERRSGGGF